MTRNRVNDNKGCGPQPLPNSEPTEAWGRDELGDYARVQHQQIVVGEKQLTPVYWRLGRALALAKEAVRHGEWSDYLAKHGIDKTRASKARTIFRTFDREEDVAELTVAESYAMRRSKQADETTGDSEGGTQSQEGVQRLRRSITKITERTEAALEDADRLDSAGAAALVPLVRDAAETLHALLAYLEKQADAVSS